MSHVWGTVETQPLTLGSQLVLVGGRVSSSQLRLRLRHHRHNSCPATCSLFRGSSQTGLLIFLKIMASPSPSPSSSKVFSCFNSANVSASTWTPGPSSPRVRSAMSTPTSAIASSVESSSGWFWLAGRASRRVPSSPAKSGASKLRRCTGSGDNAVVRWLSRERHRTIIRVASARDLLFWGAVIRGVICPKVCVQ